jgi:hypothetical protein
LPGPWAIQVGYTRQFNFNNPADIQIVSASLSYELKRKPKAKTLPFNPVPAQQ